MKIKVKVCPNKCRSPRRSTRGLGAYVRMKMVPSMINRGQQSAVCERVDYGKAWILTYVCPSCGASEPVCSNDILRGSKRPKYHGTQPLRR